MRSVRRPSGFLSIALILVLAMGLVGGCSNKLPQKANPTPEPSEKKSDKRIPVAGKKILLVHSYHPEYPWVASINEGVKATLAGTGVKLEIFYMDTKRKTDKAWMLKSGELAAKKLKEYAPDLVITSDDNAQEYFVKPLVGSKTPFVFTGVDADPSKYGYPAANVTGIIERPHLQASLELARKLRPVRRIAVLSCNDSTSVAALGFMKEESLDVDVVEWKLADDFNDWKDAVKRYNKTVDAIVVRSYQALKDPNTSERVKPSDVGAWTANNATVPTIAFHDFEIRDGIMIGVVKSGFEYGEKATSYGLRILGGASPNSLPIIRADKGIKMVNTKTAAHLGIELSPQLLKSMQTTAGG